MNFCEVHKGIGIATFLENFTKYHSQEIGPQKAYYFSPPKLMSSKVPRGIGLKNF